MDEHNNGHYEQQLLAVFESCLMKGQTELKEEDLSSLCNKLQLDDHGDELKECIKKCIPGKHSISFQDFRGGLLLLLAKTQELLTQDSDMQQSHMNDCNTKTGLILDKNRLKDLWHKVNICFKENTDTSDKYFMSNHRETSALPEQLAQRIFEKLDQNSDGLISLDEFLDIFKNQTILQEELILPCKDISEKCLTNSKEDKSNYDTLQHRDSGFIQHSIVTDMWKMAGISDATSLLSDLGYNTSSINLNDLITTLCDELKSFNDSIINTDIQPHISLLKGVLILYKEELRNLNILIENITGERDKLRVDIIEANERANSLAQEIDDHHFRQEEIKQNLLKQIEHKHSEIIKDLSNQLSLERESNATTLKVKEQQLQTQQQENYQNKNKLLTALQDNQILETENENLRNQIDKLKESNNELLMQIKMLAAEHDEVEDIDAKKEEQVLHLIDRMKQLQSEIVSLRDHNDELTIQLDISRSLEDETNLRTIKNEVDTAVTSEMNTSIEKISQQEEIISCSNDINDKVEMDRVDIDTKNNKEEIISDLKNMFIKCENCSCENCDYKDAMSFIICNQSNFNSFSLNEDIDFSKSLASELETECEERTSESLRDFVVPKSNKTTTSSTKKVMHNNNDAMIYPMDTNFIHTDIKLLQNKITSLRDYPPRKEEYSIIDHTKNMKDKDITSNYSVPCNDPDKKNNMTLSSSDNSLTNLVSQEQENWWQMEKKQLTERCLELERSLDLLKAEYEECEDYWAAKLEEERQLFEQEQKISDEKFSELIAKMTEYEELISPVDKVKNGGRLSPIEEKYNLEQQYLDLEEEFDQWKIQMEKDISEKDKEIKSLFEKLKNMEKINKMDNSTQISDDSIFQPICTFCNNIPMDAFNVKAYTQLQSKMLKYEGDTSNNVTDSFKEDHIFENSMPSNHFTSQVTKEEASVGNYHLDQLSCIKQDTNSVNKSEKSESGDKGLNNISENTFIGKEEKRSKSKPNTSKKDYSLIQELIKSQISNGVHCQCLQDTVQQQQVCNIDINILESLTMKLQIQERKKRQLEEYFRQQQHHIEQVLHQTLSQHQIEVCELRCLLYNTQEKLQVQIQANTEQAKRLAGADILAKDLFIENAYLIENLKRLKQHCLLSGVNYESTSI